MIDVVPGAVVLFGANGDVHTAHVLLDSAGDGKGFPVRTALTAHFASGDVAIGFILVSYVTWAP